MVEILVMNRAPLPKKRGQRELWIVGLLVLPLVVLGFVLAAMGVLVDPPPAVAPGSPEATPGSPAATPAPNTRLDDRTADHSGDLFTIVA